MVERFNACLTHQYSTNVLFHQICDSITHLLVGGQLRLQSFLHSLLTTTVTSAAGSAPPVNAFMGDRVYAGAHQAWTDQRAGLRLPATSASGVTNRTPSAAARATRVGVNPALAKSA